MLPFPRRDVPLLLAGAGLIASAPKARAAETCTGTVFTADDGAASISAVDLRTGRVSSTAPAGHAAQCPGRRGRASAVRGRYRGRRAR